MAKVLISKPVQAKIQWLLEIVMLVPMMRLTVQISFAWGFISREGVKPSFSGYGPDSLVS